MGGGWSGAMGADDDVDNILNALSGGDAEEALPRGFAGITPTSIAAAATTDVSCPLYAFMRLQRLVLNSAALVDLCYVVDIKIGTISLNVGTQPAPAAAFARDAVGTNLEAAVWASPSVAPTIRLFNNTGGAIVFSGVLFGRVSLSRPEGAVAS